MGKQKLKGKDLNKIGFPCDQSKSLAINIMAQYYKHLKKIEKLNLLEEVLQNPEKFKENENLIPLTKILLDEVEKENYNSYELKEAPEKYSVFGKKFIDQKTIQQMDQVMRLPVVKSGSLMPDAHVGYGIPIGGVVTTQNEIIPYGVGLDIGCRMALTIFDAPIEYASRYKHQLKKAIAEHTFFGNGCLRNDTLDHEVLNREEFSLTGLLKQLHGKAARQIGTSGSGNHFVEFGEVELKSNNTLKIPEGKYLGLLSHSGSRGFGASIANYYTKVAMDVCRLPKGTQNLAWLDLNSSEGQEYWMAMNLAGDYAKACHDVIHQQISKAIGLKSLIKVENHHNFAWKELQSDGSELIVHRKGATPAKKGELGIIPGSMIHPGYIISGTGTEDALHSASHGAGRKMSRTKAKSTFTKSAIKKQLKANGVTLMGGGVDEAPLAYKNIDDVMQGQKKLLNIEGIFTPKIVRMNKD